MSGLQHVDVHPHANADGELNGFTALDTCVWLANETQLQVPFIRVRRNANLIRISLQKLWARIVRQVRLRFLLMRRFAMMFGVIGCASVSSASANDLGDTVRRYLATSAPEHLAQLCSNSWTSSPEEITNALSTALHVYEVLDRVHVGTLRPQKFDQVADCLAQLGKRATPRGMVYGAILAPTVERRIELLRLAVEAGDVDAMWRFATEIPSTPEHTAAGKHYLEWREKAARAGHPLAQLLLAGSLEREAIELEGKGAQARDLAKQRYREALQWYEMFAVNANPHQVACGQGTLPKVFFQHVERCASPQLRGGAKDRIARYYFEGMGGIPKDFPRADMWFRAAIADGVFASGDLYAQMLEEGLGVPRDMEAAERVRKSTADYHKRRVIR